MLIDINELSTEVLEKIFSHLRLDSLKNLSLVNERCNQVIGRLVCLQMSHIDEAECCIPIDVLRASSRKYRQFACSMRHMDHSMMTGAFGEVLKYCHETWGIKALKIAAYFDQFILFLEHHAQFLTDVRTADIRVEDSLPARHGRSTHGFGLNLKELRHLSLNYRAFSFLFLSLRAPKLKSLAIDRIGSDSKHLRLTFHGSDKLESISIFYHMFSRSSEPAELENILSEAPNTARLEITNSVIKTNFSAMFGNLHTINLLSVKLTPTDDPLECLHLRRLELRSVALRGQPLKLRVPLLETLVCDFYVLRSLYLTGASRAYRLVIDLIHQDWRNDTEAYTTGCLPSFRRLHLLLPDNLKNYETCIEWLRPKLSEVTELKLEGTDVHVLRVRDAWDHSPELNSILMQGLTVPKNFDSLPASVRNVSMEDCKIVGISIEFPPSVECVRVNKLSTRKKGYGVAELTLLPVNRYTPLEFDQVGVQEDSLAIGSWTTYSTKRGA